MTSSAPLPLDSTATIKRIVSLDQFRGYTVAGMFLVNYMGFFVVCPVVLKHHNTYCSYADTIMPHFMFAVGFAFRLTFGRRVQSEGAVSAYMRVVRRLLGLVLVSLQKPGANCKPSAYGIRLQGR
jgi:predicted acyltransferase